MAGNSVQDGYAIASAPILRRSSKSDKQRWREIEQAIRFAASNCTTNERPLYALLRRSLLTLGNYVPRQEAQPPSPAELMPWENSEHERF